MVNKTLFTMLLIAGTSFAMAQSTTNQETASTHKVSAAAYDTERFGDFVQVTFRHANGAIAQQGYRVNGKPDGVWKQFDENGHITAKGIYINGKREGTWFFVTDNGLQKATFKNNKLVAHKMINDSYALLD